MSSKTRLSSMQSVPRRGRGWLRTLLIGLGLFLAATTIMLLTSNLNLYPTVILLGNFLLPVTPNPTQSLSLHGALAVGFIEEGCKIAVVAFLARRMCHNSQMDGLLLGGSVGMGFAAFESRGHAFMALLLSHGYIGASIIETIIRGLLAPFGHGVGTGILGAVLFHQSAPHRFRITSLVILTYLFVSVLHDLWDGLPNTLYFIVPPGISVSLTTLALGVIGIVTLGVLYQRAMIQQRRRFTSPFP